MNPTDGSSWVADSGHNEVVHLAADGTELWRGGSFSDPQSVSVNWADGSCWVADTNNGEVVHLGIVQIWFEDDDPAISYTGTWSQYNHPAASAGHVTYSGQTGATAELTFEGTGLRWHVAKGPMLGKARAWLDGAGPLLVDLYNPSLTLVTLEKTGLSLGTHTVKVEVSGQKNPSSSNYIVDIDAFEVVP